MSLSACSCYLLSHFVAFDSSFAKAIWDKSSAHMSKATGPKFDLMILYRGGWVEFEEAPPAPMAGLVTGDVDAS